MKHRFVVVAGAGVLACAASMVQAAEVSGAVREAFVKRFPNAQINHVAPSPVSGVYEVGVGSKVFYVSADGRYVFNGNLIDLDTREDLSENYLSKQRLQTLDGYDESHMIVFEPKVKPKHTITVFTDIDCPYCRKLHEEINRYSELGVRVRYLLYPRTGLNSPSYDKAVSVWCAKNQREELTFAKTGGTLEPRTCDNPVEEHMALGRQLGLQGTPMIITDSGEQIMGYMPADRLFAQMQADDPVQ